MGERHVRVHMLYKIPVVWAQGSIGNAYKTVQFLWMTWARDMCGCICCTKYRWSGHKALLALLHCNNLLSRKGVLLHSVGVGELGLVVPLDSRLKLYVLEF